MTKEEYQDFVLRYKGCGACFPMYHTLSRFEKMWFTAIQKDVADLEKANAELKEKLNFSTQYYQGEKAKEQLTKAKELLEQWVLTSNASDCDNINIINDTVQFLSEVEK